MLTRSTGKMRIKKEPSPTIDHAAYSVPAAEHTPTTPTPALASQPRLVNDVASNSIQQPAFTNEYLPLPDTTRSTHIITSAPQVWSLRNLRQMILTHLPRKGLYAILRTSKECFGDATGILYHSVDYKVYKKVERLCTDVDRLRYYTNAIRDVNISEAKGNIGINAKLFNKLPGLQSVCKDGDRLVLNRNNVSPFSTTKATLYEVYSCGPNETGEEFHRELPQGIPKTWDIIRHVESVEVIANKETGISWKDSINVFFENWICSQGLFSYPINELDMHFNVSCQDFLEKINRLKEIGSLMPKTLICAVEEEINGPKINSMIEALSGLVEDIKMTSYKNTDNDVEPTTSITTIHEFFSNPLTWPNSNQRKLKRLEILLKAEEVDSTTVPRDINLTNNTTPAHLEYFAITLNAWELSEIGKSHSSITRSLPALSQIARGMLKIGGMSCQYALKVFGSNDDYNISETLTTLLRREIMEILRYRIGIERVGWRRLTEEGRA